tara:strand:+ start:9 stop:608 length:600 start_codon:yes stop_codon:yes gene_type:complete
MKVKIKKDKKVKEFDLIKSWDDVNLDTWIKLVDFQKGTNAQEAMDSIALLSNIPKKLVKELSIVDVALIMQHIAKVQEEQDSTLKRIIRLEGKEYGFHPSLDRITLGEFADLETYIKLGIEKYLPEVMAILYRRVTKKKNKVYTIEAYKGDTEIRAEIMRKMSASQVQAALVFFWTFVNELLIVLPSSLMKRMHQMTTQ